MKLVTIRRYSSANNAYIDASMLEASGIQCSVEGATVETMLPYLNDAVRLVVREEDEAAALKLLDEAASGSEQ